MKKFILKSLYFTGPILVMKMYSLFFQSTTGSPDLLRLGYVPNLYPDYKEVFSSELKNDIRYTKLSAAKKRNFDLFIIGDSFSHQSIFGYKNYLKKISNKDVDVLYFDQINKNPIKELYGLINNGFFNNYKLDYVVLQSVERVMASRAQNIDVSYMPLEESKEKVVNDKYVSEKKSESSFFSRKILKFFFNSLKYFIYDDLLVESVYTTKTSKQLFSVPVKKLHFYSQDVNNLPINNDLKKVNTLNETLNDLSSKLKSLGVGLIVLPAPDKYDLYYEYIEDKRSYPKPLFFELMQKMDKSYIYIDSKAILIDAVKTKKDIYFYDDTHWSPWASQIVAKEIIKEIEL